MKIAFIGLGIMGKPMAKNLLKAGHELTVFDNNADAINELVEAGATGSESSKDAAKGNEVIVTMLPNSPHVKAALLGEGGAVEGAEKGATVIDMSSIAPLASREISYELAKFGVNYLDSPVSGGEPKAVDGTLAVMVGGDKALFDKYQSVIGAMASSVTYVGEVGAGNVTKLANQVIVALNIAAMSEALTLAKKAGVDPRSVYQAIRGGLAGSTVLDAKAPMVFERNFEPGFRIDLHIKDLTNAMDTSHGVGSQLPLTSQVLEMMYSLREDGHGGCDHDALALYYEKMTNTKIAD
ncbi:2-hydroxy-3-oxopropionate reductase [Vibrio tritonius]|uniref:2-hydroxy-3-oxopropionate reductase n=1 Tax=Vibrio tritonius TaxID=1435069 RepID=UPI000838541F|nr:2-hydroxy-3-oxopropionate reductase [Vibrio tritonius]